MKSFKMAGVWQLRTLAKRIHRARPRKMSGLSSEGKIHWINLRDYFIICIIEEVDLLELKQERFFKECPMNPESYRLSVSKVMWESFHRPNVRFLQMHCVVHSVLVWITTMLSGNPVLLNQGWLCFQQLFSSDWSDFDWQKWGWGKEKWSMLHSSPGL